jgi:Xaa-Pro aminopeptidase
MDGVPPRLMADRRRTALSAVGGGVLVLPAAPVLLRSRDTEHPYRPDSELFYLTGATEPGTVAVLMGGREPRFVLFVHDRDPDTELWSGERLGPESARERFAADETHGLSELSRRLPALLQEGDRIHYRPGRGDGVERMVMDALARARSRGPRRGGGPRALVDPGEILDEMRLLKDEVEVQRIRAAVAVSEAGHREGLRCLRPGAGEWVVQAAVEGAFLRAGAAGPGYGTIVGSGPNACVLHYVDNRRVVGDDDLVLLDAGAEVSLYNGDITRTVPAAGRFSAPQRAVYEVVEAARRAALSQVRPGATIGDVHDAAVASIVDGLVALGVLEGARGDLVARAAYKPFFPHQTSHWLGLDVHDPGDYARGGASRTLEPNMVFTLEPGLYFRPMDDAAEPFQGIGVRIEDDVLVTIDGCENLSAALPTGPDDVEALVGGRW